MTSTSQAGAVFVEPLAEKLKLVFALSGRDGRSRWLDTYLAQVLQRRHNHDTFDLVRIDIDQRPVLAAS